MQISTWRLIVRIRRLTEAVINLELITIDNPVHPTSMKLALSLVIILISIQIPNCIICANMIMLTLFNFFCRSLNASAPCLELEPDSLASCVKY